MPAPSSLLFLCVANSARSQMAEGWARKLFGSSVHVQSAGSTPTQVNPSAIEVMREVGIDLFSQASKSVESIDASSVSTVITLCAEEVCPVFLGKAHKIHWPFPDTGARGGATHEDKLASFRQVRDAIRDRLSKWQADNFN